MSRAARSLCVSSAMRTAISESPPGPVRTAQAKARGSGACATSAAMAHRPTAHLNPERSKRDVVERPALGQYIHAACKILAQHAACNMTDAAAWVQ